MVRLAIPGILSLGLLAACGGGGGGGDSGTGAPTPPNMPPSLPPVDPPNVALARPISSATLCANGAAKRSEASSANRFDSVDASIGINHWHSVTDDVWTRESGSLETVMRTGAVLATEVNGDCWPDLVFTTGAAASGQIVVYRNQAGAGFDYSLEHVTAASNPIAGIGSADLDGDYRLDLVLGNMLAGDTEIYGGKDDSGFELRQSLAMSRSTFAFAFGDYSGDEWLDAFAAHWDITPPATDAAALFRNLGASSAEPGSLSAADALAGTAPPSLAHDFNLAPGFVDLDTDGHADLLIASDFATSQILLNTGAAAYSVVTGSAALSDENAAGHAIRDFDNDGQWDWFVASVHAPDDGREWPWGREGNKLYWGIGETPYLSAAVADTGVEDAGWPWGVCAEDFNNDGLTDLFLENGFGELPDTVLASQNDHPFVQQIDASLFDNKRQRARLFINQGNRTFADESQDWGIDLLTNGRGVACFDYDRDGDVDIAVAQNSDRAIFYENRHAAPDGNNFVSLRLLSVAPNTQALGAVVTVEGGGLTQRRQVGANGSFQGQESSDLHFGLGDVTSIDAITVRWPNGGSETYANLPANRMLTLLDPRMLPYRDQARHGRIQDAIAAALGYVAEPAGLSDDILLGLSWMVRIHGLALSYAPGTELIARAQQYALAGNDDAASQLRAWRRLFDPLYQITPSDYAGLSGFDAVTFAGVYCHQIPLTDSDVQSLRDSALQGGYDTTHALLALLWAIDNDCPMPASYGPEVLADVIGRVHAIADADGSAALTDLRIEAMAFLAAAGRHDLISELWVDQVLDSQLAGGGWRAEPDDPDPEDHTTGLALWLLLQLAEQRKVLTGFVAQTWDP